jgi:membrane dipeptidase
MKYLIVIAAMMLTFGLSGQTRKDVTEAEVKRVHEKALTVDTHCDTPMSMVTRGFDIGKKQATGQVDLHRMKEGGLDAMFFVAFVEQKPRTAENYEEAYRLAHQMLDSTIAQTERSNHLAEIALTSKDADRIGRKGKRAVYLALENGFSLAKDLTRIEEFYNKGARYITLSHSYHNDICDSSTDRAQPEHNGLSAFGHEVVEEMNRLGMMIDVSHISDKAFNDVISGSKAPVIASHSSVRSIARSDRNMTDDMIVALAKKGGVIQLCLLSDYIKNPDTTSVRFQKDQEMRKIYNEKGSFMSDGEKAEFRRQWNEMREKHPKQLAGVSDLVDHIDHVVKLVGVDFVGIGSDFDGGGGLSGCNDVSQFPNITRELLVRGYSEKDIFKIWGGNFFRVFSEVEKIAATASLRPK